MWLIRNTQNRRFLAKFERGVILPLLQTLVQTKGLVTNSMAEQLALYPALNRITSSVHQGSNVLEVVDSVVKSHTVNQLKSLKTAYSAQAEALAAKCPSEVQKVEVPEGLAWVFDKVFFDKFFNDLKLWNLLEVASYNKTIFITNFRADNQGLNSCPYCDIDTCGSPSNASIDHFLPRSSFPLLSMHPANLIPSCYSCNLPQSGKGKAPPAVCSPYRRQYGDVLTFALDSDDDRVKLSAPVSDASACAYLDLLKLDSRYASKDVSDAITRGVEAFQQLSLELGAGSAPLRKYLETTSRFEGLFFAKSALLRTFLDTLDEYQLLTKSS